jgi:putative hydrolase of the HAD superfamily
VRRAVLLDALGTLVELQPPASRLRALLAESGFEVSEERAAVGFAAEISYYLEHHLEGSDRERLDDLRDRCAAAMMEALELPGLDHATARRAMLGSLEFTPYPDALEGLAELRSRGHRLVVVSNWDCSLPHWLGSTGLLELVDGVVTSAEVGAAKPDPKVFQRALVLAGVDGAGAVHVGDSIENDVAGARAAGIRAILVRRDGDAAAPQSPASARLASPPGAPKGPTEVETVRALTELPALL